MRKYLLELHLTLPPSKQLTLCRPNDYSQYPRDSKLNKSPPHSTKGPAFIVIGAPKCASSSIDQYLRQHPDIFMPRKSPNYFCIEEAIRVIKTEIDYINLFSECPDGKIGGEVSEAYYATPGAAQRIKSFNPNVKIICSIRNPADRAFSGYLNNLKSGATSLPVDSAFGPNQRWVELGNYNAYLKDYYNSFGHDQILVTNFDHLRKDAQSFCENIFRFLGVNPLVSVNTSEVHNPAMVPRFSTVNRILRTPLKWKLKKYAPQVIRDLWVNIQKLNTQEIPDFPEEIRQSLVDFYRPGILELEEVTGLDLSEWKK